MPVYFSKKYTTSSNIAASGTSSETFISEDEEWGNAPFDSITIINEDSVPLGINLDRNTSNRITVLPNSQEQGRGLSFRNFSITNLDSSTAHTAGKVHILVENTQFPRRE